MSSLSHDRHTILCLPRCDVHHVMPLNSSNSRTRSNSVAKDNKLAGSKRPVSRSPPRSNKLANTTSGPMPTSSTSSNIRKVDYATMTPGKLAETFNAPTINRSYRYLRLISTHTMSLY